MAPALVARAAQSHRARYRSPTRRRAAQPECPGLYGGGRSLRLAVAARARVRARRAKPLRLEPCGIRKRRDAQRDGSRGICEAQMDLLSKRSGWRFAELDWRLMARLLRACALSIGVAAGVAAPRPAQADTQPDEYRVKAPFLYKFATYPHTPTPTFAPPHRPL